MPKRKKSKKRAIPVPPMIVVTLTSEAEKKKAMKSIADKHTVGFAIEDVDEEGSIPVVRATSHPVQLDPRKR
jgi:hypothetical protein